MLRKEDNDTLVRIGPGTPMGELMRRHWIPFLPTCDPEKHGQPQRVRLLGEDLVAFRDSEAKCWTKYNPGLESVRNLRAQGTAPKGVADPDTFMVRAVSLTQPAGVPWQEAGDEHIRAKLPADFGYAP